MIKESSTNRNMSYLNYRTSGLASTKNIETSIMPTAMSNLTKGKLIEVSKMICKKQ